MIKFICSEESLVPCKSPIIHDLQYNPQHKKWHFTEIDNISKYEQWLYCPLNYKYVKIEDREVIVSNCKCKINLRVLIKSKLALVHKLCLLYKVIFLPRRENFHTLRKSRLHGIFFSYIKWKCLHLFQILTIFWFPFKKFST